MDAQRNSGVRAYQKGVCRTKDSEATASFFLANREPSFYAPYLMLAARWNGRQSPGDGLAETRLSEINFGCARSDSSNTRTRDTLGRLAPTTAAQFAQVAWEPPFSLQPCFLSAKHR